MKNEIKTQDGQFNAPGEVRFTRILPGPIERVWDYLTISEKRAKWFSSGPMDLRVGGRVELMFRHSRIAPHETPPENYKAVHEPGVSMTSKITRCEPPRVLSYTWWPEDGTSSEVMFELTPHGRDVQLVLTHRRLADRDEVVSVSAGWHTHLDVLAAILQGTEQPPFWPTHGRLENFYRRKLDKSAAELVHA